MERPSSEVQAKPAAGARARPTIGVLAVWFGDLYEVQIVSGLLEAARQYDVNVLCLTAGDLHSPNPLFARRNVLFDLVGPDNVDGLVIFSASIGISLSPLELSRFCMRYRPLPMVSLAVELPGTGIQALLVDNEAGMSAAVNHLIQVHGHRRIAFIQGPELNADAQQRFRVYTKVLAERGLPFDPALVAPGNFSVPSGAAAVQLLLDERQADVQAIVAADDTMALGALQALQARGVRVPEEIALVGFDDLTGAQAVTPPLTTVSQSLHEQGRRAFELVWSQLRGETVPDRVVLPARLVVRESCGCLSAMARQAIAPVGQAASQMDSPLESPFEHVASEGTEFQLSEADRGGSAGEWERPLIEAFWSDLNGASSGAFFSALKAALAQLSESGDNTAVVQAKISALRRRLLPGLMGDAEKLVRAENLWHPARVLTTEAFYRAEVHQRLSAEKRALNLSALGQALIATLSIEEVTSVLAEHLPRLGIRQGCVVLYGERSHLSEEFRWVLAYDERGQIDKPGKLERHFPARRFWPRGVWPPGGEPRHMIVEPLFFGEEQLGYALFEMAPGEDLLYEGLREQISGALKAALLNQQVLEREAEREQLLSELRQRADQLAQAYHDLQENQQQLLLVEKMASLGRLTAGIAHELNTPLAAIRATYAELESLVEEYQHSVGDAEMTTEDHAAVAREMAAAIRLGLQAAQRAAAFVRGIKFQTRAGASVERHPFEVISVMEDTLLLLSHALQQANCTIEFTHAPGSLELLGSPDQLARVVTNLVTNAIEASAAKGGGVIRLQLDRDEAGVELIVRDEGVGIAAHVLPKIFDPMFTTKPFGQGTGLGLSIVHDIVVGEFGGTIHVDSREGEGTMFTLRFPSAHSG
jgi:DNA-binding LacI/PurR family transcriptional regulator/signal transduction histidine kinase